MRLGDIKSALSLSEANAVEIAAESNGGLLLVALLQREATSQLAARLKKKQMHFKVSCIVSATSRGTFGA